MEERTIETETLRMTLRDGIIYGVVLPGREQTASDAKQNIAAGRQVAGGAKWPVILDGRASAGVSRGARRAYEGNMDFASAVAVVVDSEFARIVANLFVRFTTFEMPQRMFNSVEDARAWLRSLDLPQDI